MESSALAAAYAMSAQSQTQQMISVSMVKAAHASEMAMVDMMNQAMEMVQARQAPPPAGMGGSVDKMA